MLRHFFYVFIMLALVSMNERLHIKYIALGDSYTIGEGAQAGEAFPDLLTRDLKDKGIDIELVANPSRTGWTTKDLIDNELPVFDAVMPDFVTLLIGVNDWVQGVDSAAYHKNLIFILDHIQSRLTSDRSKILLITIPDFGVTPNGQNYSRGRDISKGLAEFNTIVTIEAHNRNLPCVDIFPESQKMKEDMSLIASDGLHPSAKEYALWENLIFKVAYHKLYKVK